jgi:hypothetical protein
MLGLIFVSLSVLATAAWANIRYTAEQARLAWAMH